MTVLTPAHDTELDAFDLDLRVVPTTEAGEGSATPEMTYNHTGPCVCEV